MCFLIRTDNMSLVLVRKLRVLGSLNDLLNQHDDYHCSSDNIYKSTYCG